MAFKINESRIREVAQIEAEANCTIGASRGWQESLVLASRILDESYGLVMSNLNIQLPQSLYQRLELIAQH
jgi:hypothetical protein